MNTGTSSAVVATLCALVCVAASARAPALGRAADENADLSTSPGADDPTAIFGMDGATTSPLTLDPSFNSSHMAFTENQGTSTDGSFRVFSRVNGYYLVGYHSDTGGGPYKAFIWNVPINGNAGSFGTYTLPFYPVDAVNLAGTSKFYFTGAYQSAPSSDYDFGVYCLDFSTGGPCAGFGNSGVGLDVIPIDSNGFHDDFPVKIVAYGSSALFIAGTSASSAGLGNLDVSVAAIEPTFGDPIASFGNRPGAPGTVVVGFDRTANGADRTTNLLVTSNSYLGGHRVYVVGESQFSADGRDTDGFILALDATTGARVDGFGGAGVQFIYNDLGQTNKQDVVDAVTITRDSQLAMAGHSTNDNNGKILFLAEVDTNGNRVSAFCGNSNCLVPLVSTYDVPADIVERSGTRDLVVASTLHADSLFEDHHAFQTVQQFGRSGDVRHAVASVDVPSAIAPSDSTVSSLLIDIHGAILLAGTAKSGNLGADDYNMTLTRFIDNDSIFANQFESVQ